MPEFSEEGGLPPGPERERPAATGLAARYDAALDALSLWFMAAARILLVMMLGLIVLEIVLRNFFLISTQISDEYSGYFSCWLTLFGFIYVARNDRFIRVEFMLGILRGASRELTLIFGSLAALIVSAVVCYATAKLVMISYRFHSTSQQYSETLMWIPQSLMPVSYFMLCLISIENIVRRARKLFGAETGAGSRA